MLVAASRDFPVSMGFFVDVTPSKVRGFGGKSNEIMNALMELQSSENRDGVAYKLAEMHVSLIYDYLYTKFGAVRFQVLGPIMGTLQWLGTLGLTSAALALFARAMANQKGRSANNYSGADVTISYILLVGAIMLEISSIFIALTSSYWAGPRIAKHLHRESGGEWSGKLAQYNMIDGCIQEKQAAGVLQRAMRWIGIRRDTTRVIVSLEVKKLLLNKLLEIATNLPGLIGPCGLTSLSGLDYRHCVGWDYTKFQGQWALRAANRGDSQCSKAALDASGIQEMDFVFSAIVWHLVTHICLLADGPEVASPSKEVSNYIMYLVAEQNVMVDSDGHSVMNGSRKKVLESGFLDKLQQEGFIQELRECDSLDRSHSYIDFEEFGASAFTALVTALCVCVELLKVQKVEDRWELIAAVWMEMLCYIALNCGAGFHAKHLSTGGEFITQVKMLLFIIGLPFFGSMPFFFDPSL